MKIYKVKVNGKVYEVQIESVTEQAGSIEVAQTASAPVTASGKEETIVSPMAGTILDVKVNVGDAVEKGVKLISVDGVAPTLENIENGTYPLTVDLVLITRKNNKNARVEQMIEFILSESGQEIIRKTGYAALGN